ncbi:tether containing UBX domain for GLUT4 isoform X2 [Tachyglossus aculeatus]|nr:tether containing UBX domain for GLUT4 isoform X2 [Tachyglossus aculeatus]
MVPIPGSREGPENPVRIALQLDDGTRLQDAFPSGRTLWELLRHFAPTRECVEQLGESTPVCVYMRTEMSGTAALQKTTLKSLGLTAGNAIIRFTLKKGESPEAREPVAPGTEAPGPSGPDPRAADGAAPSQSSAGPDRQPDGRASDGEPAPTPSSPFGGRGWRLGGPPGAADPLEASAAKQPPNRSSPGGPSKPKKSRPGQEEPPEAAQAVEREAVVCHPDRERLPRARPAELPDQFFEVTVDDVRKRLAQLKSERKRLEEAPLVTKSFREAQEKKKLERYPKVVLRVQFPDRYVLQGFFRPNETVGDLRDFVKQHLGNPDLPFYLFVAPPKTVLNDDAETLFQAKLFPAALVHFGTQQPTDFYLEAQLLEATVAPSAADLLAARSTSRAPTPSEPEEVPAEPEEAGEEASGGPPEPPEPAPEAARPLRRSPGKVPKWLKLPAAGKR